jgi:alkaline phosphatase
MSMLKTARICAVFFEFMPFCNFTGCLPLVAFDFTARIYNGCNIKNRRDLVMYKKMRFALSQILVVALIAAMVSTAFAGTMTVEQASQPNPEIKNIIFLIPDGMATEGVTLARWYKAYDRQTNSFDTSVSLSFDNYASGLVRNWWMNSGVVGGVVDSAPATTAMASGIKTNDKFLGVTCQSVPVANVFQGARLMGKSTGLIATSNIQHATPAGFSSHVNDRARFDAISSMQVYGGLDVVFGGGSQFLNYKNNNLIEALGESGYQYITTRDEMLELTEGPVWGMFAPNAMAYDFDRVVLHPEQPSLAEMTAKAIELLSQNEDGFILMVEGSKIDWTAHANDPIGLISDILAFEEAFAVAIDFALENQNTLILMATDHNTGGISIGNRDSQNAQAWMPYDSAPLVNFIEPLTHATLTGEGVAAKLNENRSNIAEVMSRYYGLHNLTFAEMAQIRNVSLSGMNNVVGLMLSNRSYIGWTTHGHTGGDVVLYTYFPGNGRVVGTIDNTDFAKIIAGVWNFNLEQLSSRFFNDAESDFTAKDAAVSYDNDTGIMTVTKGNDTLVIPEFRNYVILNGNKVMLETVNVYSLGRMYVHTAVLDLIK